jgi:hypothetical protein
VPSAVRHIRTTPSPSRLMMTAVPSGSAPAATASTGPSWPVSGSRRSFAELAQALAGLPAYRPGAIPTADGGLGVKAAAARQQATRDPAMPSGPYHEGTYPASRRRGASRMAVTSPFSLLSGEAVRAELTGIFAEFRAALEEEIGTGRRMAAPAVRDGACDAR